MIELTDEELDNMILEHFRSLGKPSPNLTTAQVAEAVGQPVGRVQRRLSELSRGWPKVLYSNPGMMTAHTYSLA